MSEPYWSDDGITLFLGDCLDVLREEVAARSRVCDDPEHCVVPTSFGTDVLPVAAGAVLLDAVYANPLRRDRAPMPRAS